VSVVTTATHTVLTTYCCRNAYQKKQGSFLGNGNALAESEACVVIAEACLCLAAAAGPQLGKLQSTDLTQGEHCAIHVSCLKHLSELVDCFHKAHAGQDSLLSYSLVLHDDI
jgi:hypothetical protein